ncbi:hypothetical protein [Rummeliibacillus sp. BSL5]
MDDYDCIEFKHEGLTNLEIVKNSHLCWRYACIEGMGLFDPKAFSREVKKGDSIKDDIIRKQLKQNLGIELHI